MSNIVFCFPPMSGPINSGLKLARELKTRGHQVTYVGIADCQAVIQSTGFDFKAVYGEWFPKGWLDDFYLQFQSQGNDNFNRQLIAFLDHLLAGGDDELLSIFKGLSPDLVIISASEFDSVFWALLAHKIGLKCVYLFDVLGGTATHTVPPVDTELIADGSFWSSVKTSWAWQRLKINMMLGEWYLAWKGIDYLSSKRIKMLANYCGYPLNSIEFCTDMAGPQLRLPQIALFPQNFDFPGANRSGRYYVGASIDFERTQESFPWEKLNDSQPIVYVALSTLPLLKKGDLENFFRIVIEASSKWPEWQWILSIGNILSVDDFDFVPANVIIINRAPQLEILKRASLMITPGGPSSIKECIFFGVPMIVFPLWLDHFGNAARVVFHGLGLRGDFQTITVEGLRHLIEQIITNTKYKESIKSKQKVVKEQEDAKQGIQLIEKFMVVVKN
jgi:zeaxanthin glucosyltransferase